MSRTLKESLWGLGSGLASSLGLPRLLHSHLYGNQLSILMYHAVVRDPLQVRNWCFLDEDSFRKQIAYVKRYFRVLPLGEAIEQLTSSALESPTLVVTFDDGYQNNYDVAFPVLASYDCPATIFLTTKYVDCEQVPWFCRLNLALTLTTKRSLLWDGTSFNISTSAQKSRTGVALHKLLKQYHPYSIDGLVTDICRTLDVDASLKFDSGSRYHMLRTDAIRAMMKSGLIDFGAHTHNHSILSRLLPGERQEEILTSLKRVEGLTGGSCRFFAYPNGSAADYELSSIELLKSYGVRAAVSTISGPNTIDTPLMELRRYAIGSDLNFSDFQCLVHHVTYGMKQRAGRADPRMLSPE